MQTLFAFAHDVRKLAKGQVRIACLVLILWLYLVEGRKCVYIN